VTFKYSGGAGLKPAYLAAAEKVKKRFDEVHIKKGEPQEARTFNTSLTL
jgi:hypothetical protein